VKKLITISLIFLMMFMLSCAKKKTTAPDTVTKAEVAKEEILPPTTDGGGTRGAEQAKSATAEAPVAETSSPYADIYFDYDKFDIKPEAAGTLKSIANSMITNLKATLSVEGHCDERGTNEYNLALGDKRAKATKDHLVSLGVPSDRISTFSYGEENQVCKENAESCWSKNRRVHFVLTKGGVK